jgi:hypothetical protein
LAESQTSRRKHKEEEVNNLDLDQILKEAFEKEVRKAPARFNTEEEKYGRCPPPNRFVEVAVSGREWEWPERAHIRQPCPYCQRIMELQWGLTCPDDSALQGSLKEGYLFAAAMSAHLKHCGDCRNRLRDMKLGTVVQKSKDWVHGVGHLSLGPVELKTSTADFFSFEKTSVDGSLTVILRRDYNNQLLAKVKSPDSRNAGRSVRLSLLLAGNENLETELTLGDDGEFGSCEEHSFGEFEQLVSRMETFEVHVEWLS